MPYVDTATAATICGVKPGTVRLWAHRGHITRHRDGFDVSELLHWIDARSTDHLYVRAGIPTQHRPDTPTNATCVPHFHV